MTVKLDRDTSHASDRSGSDRGVRSWPGAKIRYWAKLPQSYQWSLRAALAAWNRTGLDMTFVRASKARAKLRITIGDTHGSDGYATVGYQRSNWVHLRPGLPKPQVGEPAAYAKVVASHIVAHELGHVLGLEHTSGCELMTPVLMLPTCSIMAGRIGYYSRIVDRPALKRTVARYGGRVALAPKASPLDPLPPRLGGVDLSGGFAANAPVKLSWAPPRRAPKGSKVLLLVTKGATCSYPVVTDFWGMTRYDPSRLRVLQAMDPGKGSVTPAQLDLSRHCYALTLVNRTGAGRPPQGKVLRSWVPAPAAPTVLSVRRWYDVPGMYDAVLGYDDSQGDELAFVARPSGQCVDAWPAGESVGDHLLYASPGEPAELFAADSADQPIPNPCLTFFTVRADGLRTSSPVTHQVGTEPPPEPPVIAAVTRVGPDSYTVDATIDDNVARLAVVVRPTGACVTTWPGGDAKAAVVFGEIDTTGTAQPCLSFFTVNADGTTNANAVTRQMTVAPAPPTPMVVGVSLDEFGDVTGHTSLDPYGQFGLAMTVDPTGACQSFPAGASPGDYAVYLYDDGTAATAFEGYSAETHPCLTFYGYSYDGVLSAATKVQL